MDRNNAHRVPDRRPKEKKRSPFSRAFLIASVSLAVFDCRALADEPTGRALELSDAALKAEGVETQVVIASSLHTVVDAMGSVQADASRNVTIRSAGSGKVSRVLVVPGQRVKTGQPLIEYVDHSLHVIHLQLAQAEASLASAEAASKEAQEALARGRRLAGGAVSSGEVERRRAIMDRAQADVVARQADIGTIRHRLEEEFTSTTEKIVADEDSVLIAPFDGAVQSLSTAVSADIEPGMPVASVVDLSSIWVIAQVLPQDAARLHVGAPMRMRISGEGPGGSVEARVTTIDGLADPQTGLVRVVSVLSHAPEAFRPGVMLDVSIETDQSVGGLVVPRSAVQTLGGESVVFVANGVGHFIPHVVRTGVGNESDVLIEGGIHQGDRIVTRGSFALKSMTLLAQTDGE